MTGDSSDSIAVKRRRQGASGGPSNRRAEIPGRRRSGGDQPPGGDQTGDPFTILQTCFDLDSSGCVVETVRQENETLTFGEQPFAREAVFAGAGEYVLGLIVEDLDGNRSQADTRLKVE